MSEGSLHRGARLGVAVQLTFPQLANAPTCGFQRLPGNMVALLISGQLGQPILSARQWKHCTPATGVLVPEATVDKHCETMFGEDEIGCSRQVSPMQPEAIPKRVRGTADTHLWKCVLGANARHIATALRGRVSVGHTDNTSGRLPQCQSQSRPLSTLRGRSANDAYIDCSGHVAWLAPLNSAAKPTPHPAIHADGLAADRRAERAAQTQRHVGDVLLQHEAAQAHPGQRLHVPSGPLSPAVPRRRGPACGQPGTAPCGHGPDQELRRCHPLPDGKQRGDAAP